MVRPVYETSVRQLLDDGLLTPEDTVFVSCGGDTDARSLARFGIKSAVIANLDDRKSAGIGSYEWAREDAESLSYADDTFDWGMIHAGLHHCRSPHFALLELLRISRTGVLVIEARDSLLMRLAIRLGLTPEYEIEDCALDPHGRGGLRNSGVPNFIYRWTEREVRKTVESAHPDTVNDLRFFYGLVLPEERMTMAGLVKRNAYRLAALAARVAFHLWPKQGNQFAFAVIKTRERKPWIGADGRLSTDFDLGFDPARYVREDA